MKKMLSFLMIGLICCATILTFVTIVRAEAVNITLMSRKLDNSTQNLGTMTVEPESPPQPPVPNLPRIVTRDTRPLPYQAFFIPPSRHVIHHWEYSGGIYVQDASMPLPGVNVYVNGPSPALLVAVYEEVPATIHLESRELDGSTANLGTMDFTGAYSLPLPYNIQKMVSGSPYYAKYYPPPQHLFDHWETTDGVWVPNPNIGPETDVYVSYDGTLRAVYKDSPLPPYDVTIAAYCYSEGTDPGVLISPAGVSTPRTFTGLVGTNEFTVPNLDPSGHTFRQWSNDEESTTISVSEAGTYTAYYDVNQKPIAVLDVDPDPPVVSVGAHVWFYGINSYDPDGDQIVAFFFDFGDGQNSGWLNYPTVADTHNYSASDEYWAKLMVKDNYGLESDWCTEVKITVLSIPGSPVAILEATPLLQELGSPVTFDASQSYDSDGWIEIYCFDYGDGVTEWTSDSVRVHVYSQGGDYSAKVLVSDNNELDSWSQPVEVTVTQFPEAHFVLSGPDTSFTPNIICEKSNAEFNALPSYDPDGTIVSYSWNFGDGATVTEDDPVTYHTYVSSGPYTVTLTVTDNKGATAFTSRSIFIDSLKWVVYFEVDYMTGHEPSDSALEYIHQYFTDNGIYVYFFIDDEIPLDEGVDATEFWQYENQYNDVWKLDDRAQGNIANAKYTLKEKWILYGTVDATGNAHGYSYGNTNAGNYIFIADQTNDIWADSNARTHDDVETVVLMHEIGHAIGISVEDVPGTDPDGDGTPEDYDDNSWSVMALGPSGDQCDATPIRYSSEYWEEKNLEFYTLSGSTLRIAAYSPVNIMVTDPFGRRVGFDSDSGETLNEITGATYTGPGTEPQEIYIPEPLEGDYVVQVFGTGVGAYEITLESVVNGSITDSDSWQGTTTIGEQHEETCRLDEDGAIVLPHDVGVTSISTSKTVVGQGFTMSINFSVENEGNYTETFDATVYVNETIITTFENIILTPKSHTDLIYVWNTTDFAKGNYTISVYIEPVLDEIDVYDNDLTGGTVYVGIPGDIDGNGIVEVKDLLAIALAYGSYPGKVGYQANLDINGNEFIDVKDILIAAINYGQHYP
ncbi:MAG: PKD domain-containing protein [Candidatus Bathyarchaeota archaeon]|nr:PKD domain-containing protein [Candidatus Bathyarchaeota archaeon]